MGDDDANVAPPPPAPADIAAALARLRACAPQRQQCCPPDSPMSPMDEAQWFNLPKETLVTTGVLPNYLPLVSADPMRVALIFSNASQSIAFVSTSPVPSVSGRGIALSTSFPSVILTQSEHGPLVTAAWFASGGGMGGGVTVYEVSLKSWPSPNPPSAGALPTIPVSTDSPVQIPAPPAAQPGGMLNEPQNVYDAAGNVTNVLTYVPPPARSSV